MTRYYFDVTDETGLHTDDVGLDLANLDLAIVEARRALIDMTRESLTESNASLSIRIRDGGDARVDLVVAMKTERPA